MLQRRMSDEGVGFYRSPLLQQLGVPHAFSTRIGGISPAPFDSLNLGNPSGCAVQDDSERIQQNYQRLQRAVGVAGRRRVWVHQVHGEVVLDADADGFEPGAKADGLISADTAKLLAIRTADCVPVLLASDGGRRVAAVHAGWRGVIAGVVPAAVRMLGGTVVAAIGPCIGFDAFEVGPEVLSAFRQAFEASSLLRHQGERGFVDLQAACRMQLLNAGVREESIDSTDRCTFRDADEFFSHRRDHGITGRMAAVIGAVSST